ncbi:hypothetical protein GCM10025867_23710 [Frondihabitans sucicola]|uniref:Uncharacterized protein n=1 Tax=Frondihabitans sucicola TaxID=1268041 RepID=A0ABN6Y2M0_9MICO|nr:hypothetical protein [Frondihabitans sucicola]BDZ50130.1 hypothetical protein GCM10025867_23710 [Frondihabitans sucicola]
MLTSTSRRTAIRNVAITAFAASFLVATPLAANAATTAYPSDTTAPDLVPLLSGYDQYWTSDGVNDLHGKVLNAKTLSLNDKLAVWINNSATSSQKFRALQDSEYQTADGTAYDQSVTIAGALGSKLSAIYVAGRNSGALP